jgi:hypothetical protein
VLPGGPSHESSDGISEEAATLTKNNSAIRAVDGQSKEGEPEKETKAVLYSDEESLRMMDLSRLSREELSLNDSTALTNAQTASRRAATEIFRDNNLNESLYLSSSSDSPSPIYKKGPSQPKEGEEVVDVGVVGVGASSSRRRHVAGTVFFNGDSGVDKSADSLPTGRLHPSTPAR